MPLNQRNLRVSIDSIGTEYRWIDRQCTTRILGVCFKHVSIEKIERDFDFNLKEDRIKFNDMGFDCAVRKKP